MEWQYRERDKFPQVADDRNACDRITSKTVLRQWLVLLSGNFSRSGSCVTSNVGPNGAAQLLPFVFGDQVADPKPPQTAAVKRCYGASGDEIASVGGLFN